MRYYKSDEIEMAMNSPDSLRRYAGLARKTIKHYLGDLYNPETFPSDVEFTIRSFIKGYVELKVFDKEPYDWNCIDYLFRKLLHDNGFKHITYETHDKGYNGVMRGELPEHHA